jgi:hypothetical protein
VIVTAWLGFLIFAAAFLAGSAIRSLYDAWLIYRLKRKVTQAIRKTLG